MQKRITLMIEQNAVLVQRSFLADSALKISTLESKFWYDKLHENDRKLENERIKITWIGADEGRKFAETVEEMTEEMKKLGPNPFKDYWSL